MRKILIFMSLCICSVFAIAQDFTGSIEFKYATQKDTTENIYFVKNKLVKLDQFAKHSKNIEGSFIFDLTNNEIKFVNPKRKLWGKQKSETPQVIRGQCVVTKGSSTKTFAGVKCSEYVVKNAEEDVTITFWIATDHYNFFIPLIKLWNRKDKQSIYFGQIKNLPQGSMPFMSEEKQLSTGKMLTKLEVVKINKTIPDDASLSVPGNYSKFDQ